MSRYLIDRIEAHNRILVLTETTVSEARGGQARRGGHRGPERETTLPAEGLFLLIGAALLTRLDQRLGAP